MKLKIEKTLVLSTSHITQNDMELLGVASGRPNTHGLIIFDTLDWAQVHLGEEIDLERLEKEGYSKDFCTLIAWCQSMRIDGEALDYVKFDCDGTIVEWLNVFDW